MKKKRIVLELTPKEAGELFMVALNGYGDGDYYDWQRRNEKYFVSAFDKLADAMGAKRIPYKK